jgi:hypothetical protein
MLYVGFHVTETNQYGAFGKLELAYELDFRLKVARFEIFDCFLILAGVLAWIAGGDG